MFNGSHQPGGRTRFSEVLQHHDRGPERADRIGYAATGDIQRGPMDRLEHRRKPALRVQIRSRRNTQAARQRGREVGKDVSMQISRHHDVQRGGSEDHAHGGGIDQHLVGLDLGETGGDLRKYFVPHYHAVALRVGFGNQGQLPARALTRQRERKAMDAFDTRAGKDGNFGGDLLRQSLVRAAALTRVFALGILAHDHPVEIGRRGKFQRRIDARQHARRTHVGVLVEALADIQTQTPEGDVIRYFFGADRAEIDGIK